MLSVKLSQPYLGAAHVDSAFAIWNTNGQQQRIKMNVSHDSLIAEMSIFNEGTGELPLHIFSNKKYSNQYYGQWISHKRFRCKRQKLSVIPALRPFTDAPGFPV
ncbi:MAG: hypothetical protein WDO16_17060 [Bacteroidota bacterium]